jgi:hypothetical protein
VAAVLIDAEFVGGTVVVLEEFNPITIPIVRAREDKPGSIGMNESGFRFAGNFDCKLTVFSRDQNSEFVRCVRDVCSWVNLERIFWDFCGRNGSAQ